jgi:hypothetical protein
LISGDCGDVVQDEKRSPLYDLEYRISKKHRILAKLTPPHHDDGNQELKGVGSDPEVVPQE